jgi:hypothetical protein
MKIQLPCRAQTYLDGEMTGLSFELHLSLCIVWEYTKGVFQY